MEALINVAIVDELENAIRRDEMNMERRILRDHSDPFNTPEKVFLRFYRLDKQSVHNLIELMRPHLAVPQRQSSVSLELKVLTMLYYLGHGSYQKCVGNNFELGLEQSTVSRIITETTNCMVNHLMDRYVTFANDVEGQNVVKQV
ncbi:hypothetical protein RI129_005281 [Pyrocoelia pectoralis]|uniref:Nuclease HARBI1 n=1 Tax=Pyrocoelia pectoralis TaxID=417401 RepID=A0AAN7ZK80_9COLE